MWQEAGRKLVVADLDRVGVGEVAALEELRTRFSGEVTVLGLRGESNAQGAVELGLGEHDDTRRLLSRCRSGGLRALILLGLGSTDRPPSIRLRGKPGFLLVVDAVESALSRRADVVLPGAFWMEDEGTFTNPEGRIQRVASALAPPGGRANWEVVAELAGAFGVDGGYGDAEDVFAALSGDRGWETADYEALSPWGARLVRKGSTVVSG